MREKAKIKASDFKKIKSVIDENADIVINALTTASNRSQGWCVRLWDDVEIRQFLAEDFGGGSGAVGMAVDNNVDAFERRAAGDAREIVVGA